MGNRLHMKYRHCTEFCGTGFKPVEKHGQDGRDTLLDTKFHTVPKYRNRNGCRRAGGRDALAICFAPLFALILFFAGGYWPAAIAADTDNETAAGERLSDEQRRIADKYKHLEEVLLRMAELSASTDPERAELLRKAVAQSKHCLIDVQFERLIELLQEGQLSRAMEGQTTLDRDLVKLLELLLSENRAEQIASEKERMRRYLKQLNRIIRQQKIVEGRTEGRGDLKRLAGEQNELAQKTGRLSDSMEGESQMSKPGGDSSGKSGGSGASGEGKPGGGESAGGQSGQGSQNSSGDADSPAGKRLKEARDKMQQAQKALEEARREGAVEKQEQALELLEEAKSELEEILRQLREEEMKRMLMSLQARFKNMLKLERVVYKSTLLLDKVPPDRRMHEHEIAAGRLSDKQSKITFEADKTLALLKEDGTSVAFPEAVMQMRADMQEAARRLDRQLTGQVTQGIEQDILAALEEMIEALQNEIEKLEEGRSQKSPPGSARQEPPLVAELAELRMVRALQMRVNRRTAHYSKLVDGDEAHNADLREALRRLALREARIHEVTRELELQGIEGGGQRAEGR